MTTRIFADLLNTFHKNAKRRFQPGEDGEGAAVKMLRPHFIVVCAILLFLSCENPVEPEEAGMCPTENRVELIYSRKDSTEGKTFALWYSGDHFPSDSLVCECLYSLNYLRHVWGDSVSFVNERRFLAPWATGQVIVKFDENTALQVRNYQYRGWDILDDYLRPVTIIDLPDQTGSALLGFDDDLHPRRIAELYSTLPGVITAESNGILFAGIATFPINPGRLNNEFIYLFKPSTADLYYFTYRSGEPEYLGFWNRWAEPEPDWWEEASTYIPDMHTWDGP